MTARSALRGRRFFGLALGIGAGIAACNSAEQAHDTPVGSQAEADMVNGDFETGTLGSWTVTTKKNGSASGNGSGITTFPPQTLADLGLVNGGTNLTSVVNSSTTGSPIPAGLTNADSLRYPFSGSDSAVVNAQGNNTNANVLTQSAQMVAADVDPSDGRIHFRFAAAPVLNNPTHLAYQQPYFFIELRNTTRNLQLFHTFNFANQPGVSWKVASGSGGAIQYTDWEAFDIAPGAAAIDVGETVSATVVAAGCAFTAHWGEVYVDQFGTAFPLPNVHVSAPSFVPANSDLTYTVLVKNGGASPATNVVVDFTTPMMADSANTTNSAATTFTSVAAPGATCTTPTAGSAGTVTCNIGSLSPGGSYTLTVTVHVPTVPGGWTAPVYVNEGTYDLKADSRPLLTGGVVQTQVTTSTPIDLSATLTDGVASVIWGQADTYTFTVTNNGPNAANGVAITDVLPATLTGVTWTCAGTGGGACGAASGSGSLNTTANLPVNGQVTYTIHATVTGGPATQSVSYQVTATPPAGMVQTVPFDNVGRDTDSATTGPVTLTVNKDPASTGQGTVVSSPAVISCGPSCSTASASFATGTSVALWAIAPVGHTFVGWSGACTGLVSPCVLTVSADTTVSARFDAPTVSANIAATSNGGATNVRPGDTVDYAVTVHLPKDNNAPLVLTDVFPAGLSFVSSTAPTTTGTVTCSAGGSCASPIVTPGASTTVDFGAVTCTTVGGCDLHVTLQTRVADTATRGTNLVDAFGVSGGGTGNAPAVVVVEPNLTLARSPAPSSGLSGTQPSTVTVTLANNTGGADSPAYDAVVTLPTPATMTAGGYSAGTCPPAVASFGATNATFTFPAGTSVLAAGASCTFSYVLTPLPAAPPNGSVVVDPGNATSQSIPGSVPPAKAYTATDAGFSLGIAGLPNGTPCGSPSVCASLVCDPKDNKCGYDDGDGPCTSGDAGAVCRSGTCSVSGVCKPAGGCEVDGDCAGSQFCNTQTKACTPKLTNGTPIPTLGGHTPALDGTCSASVGGAVCVSGVCDTKDNACGYADGDGPCTTGSGPTVCRSGICSASGVCKPAVGCAVDGDCTGAEFCNTQTHACASKLPNGTAVPTILGHTPVLDGTCSPAVGAIVCTSGVCDTKDNACGYADGDGPCDMVSGGTVCRSGSCSAGNVCKSASGCRVDGDCAGTEFCNTQTFTCTPKLPNATPIPTLTGHAPPLTGVCSAAVGTAVCASGVCDTKDNECGLADNDGPCTATDGAKICRSGVCSASGVCLGKGACRVDADCTANEFCDTRTNTCTAKLPNGEPIPIVAGHSPDLAGRCDATAGTIVCVSAVCDTVDDRCGYADGDGSCDGTNASVVCRSGQCSSSGRCQPAGGCLVTGDCPTGQSCDPSSKRCTMGGSSGSSGSLDGGAPPDDGVSIQGGGLSCASSPGKSSGGGGAPLGLLLTCVTLLFRARARARGCQRPRAR